jgi:signal transduction histidine kinase
MSKAIKPEQRQDSSPAMPISSDGVAQSWLHGQRLLVVRLLWLAIAGVAFVLCVLGVPVHFESLRTICITAQCHVIEQLTPENFQAWHDAGFSIDFYATYVVIFQTSCALIWFLVGIVIFWRKSDNWMALFVALFLVTYAAGISGTVDPLARFSPVWQLPVQGLGVLSTTSFGLFFYLFPDGRFVPRWMRWLAGLWIAAQVIFLLFPSFVFPTIQLGFTAFSPLPWNILFFGFIGSMLFAQVYRYRRVSDSVQRRQSRWVIFGVSFSLLGFVAILTLSTLAQAHSATGTHPFFYGGIIAYLCQLLIPLSIVIAVFRSQLFDIEVLIKRTLVYGLLTVCVVVIYMTLVIGLGTVFRSSENFFISLFATALVAVLFQPLRAWLQRRVNRLLYGERDVPYQVISRLGQRLEATLEPSAVLPMLVETVGMALKLPYAAIRIQQDDEWIFMASYGKARERTLSLPLSYAGEKMGELVLASRPGEEAFALTDLDLLTTLARQAGVAVHAVLLTTELERSRQRIVAAREEGRRRLGSDLHDGLGHQLTGLLLKTELVLSSLHEDQGALRVLLNELHAQIKTSVDEVRNVAHRLHPPELELFGLTQAIQEKAGQYQGRGKDGMRVQVHIPHKLESVPLAVEVAAYYIVGEALTNASRHASASICRLSLQIRESSIPAQKFLGGDNTRLLEVDICDDGCGLAEERGVHQVGLGILSMRERASELGGTCIIEPVSTGGTRVYAQLPCPDSA